MAKRSKSSIPKKVAGVKMPAAIRHPDWVLTALSSPLVREAIAAALVAGAGAAAAVLSRTDHGDGVKKAGAAIADTAGDVASAAAGTLHAGAAAVAGIVAEAAERLMPDSAATDGKVKRGDKQRRSKPKLGDPQPLVDKV